MSRLIETFSDLCEGQKTRPGAIHEILRASHINKPKNPCISEVRPVPQRVADPDSATHRLRELPNQ